MDGENLATSLGAVASLVTILLFVGTASAAAWRRSRELRERGRSRTRSTRWWWRPSQSVHADEHVKALFANQHGVLVKIERAIESAHSGLIVLCGEPGAGRSWILRRLSMQPRDRRV